MQSDSKVFLIDIDGVMCNHAEAICSWVNKQYSFNSEVKDITTYDHDFGGITFCEAVDACYPNKDFILTMEVYEGFLDFLNNIKKEFTVKFASARKHSHDSTRLWVQNKIGDYDVTFVKNKSEIECDYLIEDYHKEALEAVKSGHICFLIKRPWNNTATVKKEILTNGNIHHVDSFEDILMHLDKY